MKRYGNLLKFAGLCTCAILGFQAFAGERLIGVINSISTSKSNCGANVDGGGLQADAGMAFDGGIYPPFIITQGAMLTLQCDTEVYAGTDLQTVTAINGLDILPQQIFLTQVGGQNSKNIPTVNGGQMNSACVSILPLVADGGFKGCKVFERNGKE